MKPRTFLNNRLLLVLLIAGLTAGLISWDYKQSPGQIDQSLNDTTPKKKTYDRNKKVKNLDDVLDELENAEFKMNIENISKELSEAMKSIDGEKIKREIDKAMKELDLAKIQLEVKKSLAKVDLSEMKEELAEAMKSIDIEKIQKEVQESISKVDWSEMKAELEKVKNIDFKKMQKELQEIGPKLEKDLKKAKVEIEKAKVEIKEFKNFIDGLDSDGLIDKKAAYHLKHENGELYINGEKATQKTYTKYRRFLEEHNEFNIKINDGEFKFDID